MKFMVLLLLLPLVAVAQSNGRTFRTSASRIGMGEHVEVLVALVAEDGRLLELCEVPGRAGPRPRPNLKATRKEYSEQVSASTVSPLMHEASVYVDAVARLVLDGWFSIPRTVEEGRMPAPVKTTLVLDTATGAVLTQSQPKDQSTLDPRLGAALCKVAIPRPPALLAKAVGPRLQLSVTVFSIPKTQASRSSSAPPQAGGLDPQGDTVGELPLVKEPRKKAPAASVGVELLEAQGQ